MKEETMNEAMKKIGIHSHFELINGKALPALGDKILQIDSTMQYLNEETRVGVYMCEISDYETLLERKDDAETD